jgi:predicted AAA+ superfamily ATPase
MLSRMYTRALRLPPNESVLLLGPRGTGKSTMLRASLPGAVHLDLLDIALYGELLAHPERLEAMVTAGRSSTVVIDEVQRLPGLLEEVHRLIEARRLRFVLTGSSARKLRRGGANLLAGRARTLHMHPLTAVELGRDFRVERSVRHGHLPIAVTAGDPERYLASYVGTYLREEVMAEALTRNLDAFSRFLVAASFAQASVLSIATIARDIGLPRKTVEGYFELLEDLLLGVRLPVFSRRAKRATTTHPKFYYFDCGVFRALRPRGPLDPAEEIDGAALETLVFQELRATNENLELGYALSFWRTRDHREVDFVLYGERGLVAIEVKRAGRFREDDLTALRDFREEFPPARPFLLYGGTRRYEIDGIRVLPLGEALRELPELLGAP